MIAIIAMTTSISAGLAVGASTADAAPGWWVGAVVAMVARHRSLVGRLIRHGT